MHTSASPPPPGAWCKKVQPLEEGKPSGQGAARELSHKAGPLGTCEVLHSPHEYYCASKEYKIKWQLTPREVARETVGEKANSAFSRYLKQRLHAFIRD